MGYFECPPEHKHGETVNCYDKHRCRCQECRDYRREVGELRRRKALLKLDRGEIQHGTNYSYKGLGCRCDTCRWAAREEYAKKNNICPPDHKHDQTSTCYNLHKCRCRKCELWNKRRVRDRALPKTEQYRDWRGYILEEVDHFSSYGESLDTILETLDISKKELKNACIRNRREDLIERLELNV